MTRRGSWRWGPALALALLGCSGPKAPEAAKAAPHAKVEKLPGESDLTTVTLSEEAEKRLGVKTFTVRDETIVLTRALGGEVMVPPGGTIAVAAPLSGTLRPPPGGVPRAGATVKSGQVLFQLVPLLSPDARTTLTTTKVEAQGQLDQATQQRAAARLLYDRSEKLRRDGLGGAGAVEDAKAQLALAEAGHAAASSRSKAIEQALKGALSGQDLPVPIMAESDGVLRNVLATAGQKVAAGAALFEVVALDPINVRVPVYAGDLAKIDGSLDVSISGLTDPPGSPTRPAKRIEAPPSADALAATVDLWFEAENPGRALRPGQRVSVQVPYLGGRKGPVLPRSALLRDVEGGTWVYEEVAPHKYARRRVRVEAVVGDKVAISAGPKAGGQVLTDGAAEVFGAEFGGAK